MVLKQSKLGQKNGNSFHSYCFKRRNTRHGCIAKFVLDRETRRFTDEEKEEAVERSWELIPDSSLVGYPAVLNFRPRYMRFFGWGRAHYRLIMYSINKKERWTIPEVIKSSVKQGAFEEEEEEVMVSINERKIRQDFPLNMASGLFSIDRATPGTRNISYTDSQQTKADDKSHTTKKNRRRKHHNQHFRGVQRDERIDFNSRNVEIQNENESCAVPRVHYEVLYSEKDRKCHHYDHIYRNSRRRGRRYPLSRCRRLHMDIFNEVHWFDDSEVDCAEESEMNTSHSDNVHTSRFCLSDYIYSEKDTFSAKTKNIKRKPNTHPNTASSNSRFYGKDMVIYMKETEDSKKDDDDSGISDAGSMDAESTTILSINPPVIDSLIVCAIHPKSIESYQIAFPEKCWASTNCLPPRLAIRIDGGVTSGDLVIWPKNVVQADTDCGGKEYWMKLSVHGDDVQKEIEHVNSELQKMIPPRVVMMIERVIDIAQNLLKELISRFPKLSSDEASRSPGNSCVLEQVCRFHCDVQTIDEAHRMLESTSSVNIKDESDDYGFEKVSYCDVDSCQSVPEYCGTCFADVDSGFTVGTMMLPCQHFFCNDCWTNYTIERSRNGNMDIKCQAYKCGVTLEDVAVMSFLPCNLYNAWIKRKKENLLECSNKWKWCPNTKCNKVARVIQPGKCRDIGNVSVQCLCNSSWCFSCQKERHWPAVCDQREIYYKMLKQNGDESAGKVHSDSAVYYVDVKKCPACHYPMEKSGGCQHMSCRCGHGFCWECLRSWDVHVRNGLRCVGQRAVEITIELENHMSYPVPIRYYKLSVKCRKTRLNDLSMLTIRRRCAKYAARIQASNRRYKIVTSEDDVSKSFLLMQNYLLFVRQMYEILEHMYVMMSHMTKKTHSFSLQRLVDRLLFCMSRIEARLQKEEEKPLQPQNFQHKIAHLRATASVILNHIATVVPSIQKAISSSKQKLLEKPLETIEFSYK